MNRSTKIILAGLAITVTAGGAYAAQQMRHFGGPGQFGQRMFDTADADKDGAVSLEEMMAVLASRFDDSDANKDGSVDKAEVIASVEKNFERARRHSGRIADRIVVHLDLDDNGSVARAELENRAKKMFALADFNDDGKVEKAELRRMHPRGGRHHAQMEGRHEGRWHHGPGRNSRWMDDDGPGSTDD